jgi:hypothetical protein
MRDITYKPTDSTTVPLNITFNGMADWLGMTGGANPKVKLNLDLTTGNTTPVAPYDLVVHDIVDNCVIFNPNWYSNPIKICYAVDVEPIIAPCSPISSNDATCDDVDDDCDTYLNEDYVGVASSCGVGACARTGTTSCVHGAVVPNCTPGSPPATNDTTCDNVDDDCDGNVDDNFPGTITCGTGPCARSSAATCVNGVIVGTCTPGSPPATNDTTCDNVDDDCDGNVDDDFPGTITCGQGECQRTATATCVNGHPVGACTPGAPGKEGVHDGKDNDCDGVIDNEVCDGIDNDGNGKFDDAPGSCVHRHLFIPVCWNGTQDDFNEAVDRWSGFFKQSGLLSSCSEKFWFQAAPVDLLGCPAANADLAGLLKANTGEFALTNWDTVSVVRPVQPGCVAGQSLGGGFISLSSGGNTPFAGEYVTFSHEWGHAWLGTKEEYSSARNGSPNLLQTSLGCDPTSQYSTDPNACCGRDNSCLPAKTFCLGNLSLDLSD